MIKSSVLALVIILVLVFGFALFSSTTNAQSYQQNLSGWAWSSSAGWISFGSWPDRVKHDPASGNLSGYAWSSNIGWIRFDPIGPYPNSPNHGARLEIVGANTMVTGWARACSVFLSGCSGAALKSDVQRGGWDGWIKMSKDTTDFGQSYGVTKPSQNQNLEGYAWGDEVLGWINFCDTATGRHCVKIDEVSVSCQATQGGVPIIEADLNGGGSVDVEWRATINYGGLGATLDNYCWGSSCTTNIGGGVTGNSASVTKNYITNDLGNQTAVVKVANANGEGQATCSVEVIDSTSADYDLDININGLGNVTAVTPLINCLGGSGGQCSYQISNGSNVDLVANDPDGPGVGFDFQSWSGDVPSTCLIQPVPTSCTVNMNRDRRVTATFYDPNATPPTLDLISPSPILRVDLHNSGLPVRSPAIAITNTSSTTVSICVKELKSKVNDFKLNGDSSSDSIINVNALGPDYLARCHFANDDISDKTCDFGGTDTSISSVSLAPYGMQINNEDDTASFSITIPKKLELIKDYSPYKVTIGVCGTPLLDPSDQILELRYQPLDFVPL